MTIPPSDRIWTPEETALAERLGREGRVRILQRMGFGTTFLAAVKIEADYIADAWAHYDDKVQMRAIQIAFEELHHLSPRGTAYTK